MKTRIQSFLWRAGVYTAIAVAAYVVNFADIREIDPWKLLSIFVLTISGYIVNEGTKWLNSEDKPQAPTEDTFPG